MGDVGGRPAYLVQWQLSNGRIVVFTVDAQTGQVDLANRAADRSA